MAIWQWDMLMVPKNEVKRIFSLVPNQVDEHVIESIEGWNGKYIEVIVSFLNRVLPSYSDYLTENVKHWGSEDKNRVDLTIEEDRITNFLIRIDLRNLDNKFLKSLIDFARKNEFLFFSFESSNIINPTISELIREIHESKKMKFINNPKDFFEDQEYFDQIRKKNKDKANKVLKD